jgi:phosphate starvation-inducible protein PhoH and related proteins
MSLGDRKQFVRKTIEIDDRETTRALLGAGDCHLRRVRDVLGVDIVARNDLLHLEGADESVDRGVRAFLGMLRIIRKSQHLESVDVDRILSSVTADDNDSTENARRARDRDRDRTPEKPLGGRVHAMTPGQARYLEAIKNHDIVFAIGPAGSGKTYLAVAAAIDSLVSNQCNRIVLVRPAVEAGERLGFLPGDLQEKVNPYLRPLYDALHDMLNPHQVSRYSERGVIEIAPLAFMRGRTLNNAFVILDEAQNTTPKQMKMFLTRLGRDARAVITGDVTQVDLPDGDLSGLAHARDVLHNVDGVSFVTLEKQDIVRHPLVQRIVNAYDISEGID